MLKTVTIPATTSAIGEMLSSQLAKEWLERRKCLFNLLSNARFLSRQGLNFRGDVEESDSNFMQLIYLRSEDNRKLVDWVHQKTDKYTSHDIQDDMVKVMALRILREIAANLQSSSFFTVMVDETTDVSNVEQVVVCLRWVSEGFEIREEFVGYMKWHRQELKRCKIMQDALDTTREITKLIKRSPARNAIFKRLKEELASVIGYL